MVQLHEDFCYEPGRPLNRLDIKIMLESGRPLDLKGLTAALCVEELGAWHLYNPTDYVPPAKEKIMAAYSTIISFDAPTKLPRDPRWLRLLVDASAFFARGSTRERSDGRSSA